MRHRHADAHVDAELDGAFQLERLLVDNLASQGVRGEVLHRDGVQTLDVQEVVDADDVLVRDLARVTQLVDEALHHFFVPRHIRVQELQNQALVDDRVLHQQHGAEGAAADAIDVFVAPLNNVARFQRLDIQARGSFCLFRGLGHGALGHEQGLRALRRGYHWRQRLRRTHGCRREGRGRRSSGGRSEPRHAVLQLGDCGDGQACDGLVG